jgi:hypothetical protein
LKTFHIRTRLLREVNADPQRRCYDGVHAKSETEFGPWSVIDSRVAEEVVQTRLKFWRDLNAYAVEQRGRVGTFCEFEAVENNLCDAQ